MAKREGRYTPADAANSVGLALLLFLALSLLCQLAGQALLSQLYPAWKHPAGEWVAETYSLVVTVVSFGSASFFLLRRGHSHGLRLNFTVGRLPLWVLLLLFLGCMAAANVLSSLLETSLRGLLSLPDASSAELPETIAGKLLYFAGVCLASPLLEELFFRGAVQGTLRPFGPRMAILLTTILFTLLHSHLWDLPAVFLLSLLLGYVAEVSGSLLPCVLLHFANNAYAFFTLLLHSWLEQVPAGVLLLWQLLLPALLFVVALWAAGKRRLWPRMRLPRDKADQPGRKPRWRRVVEAPALLMALVATTVYFATRIVAA